jgi:predicted kinase
MVTLICGPPCSGKSTLAKRLAQPHDVVLDFDAICVELGSTDQWAHSKRIREQAEALMQARISRLPHLSGVDGYVIRTAPEPRQREQLARTLGAQMVVWVLDPGFTTCVRRARSRPRGTVPAIRRWYARYGPSVVDVPCPWVEQPVHGGGEAVPMPTSRAW